MKKQNFLQTVVAAFMAVATSIMLATPAFAHPGHDHSANEAMSMHVLFYGSIGIALTVCAWFVYRQVTKQNNK